MARIFGVEFNTKHLDLLSVGTWLLKDAGWVLLCPFVTLPATLAAIAVESYSVLMRRRQQSLDVLIHSVATFIWLVGNSVWMASELLFEPEDSVAQQLPWFFGPLAGDVDADKYEKGAAIARRFFSLALLLLALLYLSRFVERMLKGKFTAIVESQDSTDTGSQALVFGIFTPHVYAALYIGPWILKDLFWTLELLVPALCCSVLVITLIVDCIRRFADFVFVAELCWALGNVVWLFSEIALGDAMVWPPVLAALLLVSGLVVLCAAWRQTDNAHQREKFEEPTLAERLLGA